MALATILGFDVWSLDVKQAYVQSASELQRKVFFRPTELNLDSNELLQIIRPLYGLTDSGDYWCETFARFHLYDIRMQQTTGDFAIFFRRCANRVVALSGSYVDDILHAGSKETKATLRKQIKDKFDITSDDATDFVYCGILCDTSNPKRRPLSQAQYIKKLQYLQPHDGFSAFRSLRARLMWVVHTRPNIACAASFASQVTANVVRAEAVTFLNKVVKYLRLSPEVTLLFPKLDQTSLRLVIYSDASHNNREENRSQLGYVILTADASNKCAFLHFLSHKSVRVTRSSMAGETLAFIDAFDNAFLIRHDLENMLRTHIRIIMMTDCIQLFHVITRDRYTSERRLMIEISAIREAYSDRMLSNIALIRSEFNPSDSLTKLNGNSAVRNLPHTHHINQPVEQWVIETCQT